MTYTRTGRFVEIRRVSVAFPMPSVAPVKTAVQGTVSDVIRELEARIAEMVAIARLEDDSNDKL